MTIIEIGSFSSMTKSGRNKTAARQAANEAALAAAVSPEEATRARIRQAREARDEATRRRVLGLQEPTPEGIHIRALELRQTREGEDESEREDIEVDRAGDYKLRAMRWDVFELMYKRRFIVNADTGETSFPLAWHTAVRRLQDDIAILYGTQGGNASVMAGTSTPDPLQAWLTEDFSIRRVLAAVRLNGRPPGPGGAERVQGVLGMLKPWARKLLLALCIPEMVKGERVNWRVTVKQLTGEGHPVEQGKLVREACKALAQAYAEIDNEPAERRAS